MREKYLKFRELAIHQKKWYSKWHTWAGISAGFVLMIVSFTGAFLVFEEELDVWLHPQIFTFSQTTPLLSYQALTETIHKDHPTWEIRSIYRLKNKNNAVKMFFNGKRGESLIINPHTGKLAARRVYKRTIMGFIRTVHRSLMLPFIGRYLVGFSSLICLLLVITGLRQWLPKNKKQLWTRLKIRFGSGKKRANYDFHNSVGLYISPFLCLIAITGVMITFSKIVLITLSILNFQSPSSFSQIFKQKSTFIAGKAPLSLGQIVDSVHTRMPKAVITSLRFPRDSTATYQLNTVEPSISQTGDKSMVFVDQYSGQTLFSTDQKEGQFVKVYFNWVTPLHFGTFGGLTTRIIALLTSIFLLLLFLSGFYIGYKRWKKRMNRRNKTRKSNV